MATKKTSTKAKTKTTKTTKAAKTTTKTKATKVVVPAKKTTTLAQLRSLHMMSAGLFILLALAAGMLMSNQSYQVTLSYLTEDVLSGALLPASRVWFDIEIRWVLVGILVLSAVTPFLYMTRWEKNYTNAVTKTRVVPWRWLDFAVTAALMVEVVALLSGLQDMMPLKLVGGLVGGALWLAWIAEKQNDGAAQPIWGTYTAGVAAGALPWIIIGLSAVATVIHGGVWSPWHVYALYGVTLAGALSLAYIQMANYRRRFAAWQENYLIVERNYLVVNLLTKAAFAGVLIVGLLK